MVELLFTVTTHLNKLFVKNKVSVYWYNAQGIRYAIPRGQMLQHSPSDGLGGIGSGQVGTGHLMVLQSIISSLAKQQIN